MAQEGQGQMQALQTRVIVAKAKHALANSRIKAARFDDTAVSVVEKPLASLSP